ncbi:hypothetical protein Adeg_0988 [Ammonifex degensii KC4]|uniref:Uncharacterized protein n=1 Tax=Ammonifex degensii (strain DSM 10501 / KC4) TaxID=429009 RepID=C9RCZ6_AMMDK|nr:hypothetical protein [Ammonifex degensii]ACX52123.1 hypothetical protein Adeg_0988 [Ammonifex degensii KC4]
MDWEIILREAEGMARCFKQNGVDLNEAKKVLDYYVYKRFDEEAMACYLQTMASNPPLRSKKTQGYYQKLRDLWLNWNTGLKGRDKARAWGWAIRLAKAGG